MKIIEDKELEKICGGTSSFTSGMVNAITNTIKFIKDAGYSFGSAIRRIGEGNLCPLK